MFRKPSFLVGALLCVAALHSGAQPLIVGQIGPFTGLGSPDALEIQAGAKAYLEQINESGGVRGRKLELISADDEFNGEIFGQRFRDMQKRRPVALLSPIGSAAMTKLLKDGLLDNAELVVVNAIPGAESFRSPGHRFLFHVRAGDKQQIEKIITHCKTVGMRRLFVVHQDLEVGTAGLAVAKATAEREGGLQVDAAEAKHDDARLDAAIRSAIAATPDGLLFVGSPKFMADGLARLRTAGSRQWAFALSYLPAPLAMKVAGPGARGLGITQAYPNPHGARTVLQRDFQRTMARHAADVKEYSPFHLEGYVAARVLVAGLRRINGEINAKSLQHALATMPELDLGGFYVDFSSGNAGSAWVEIGVINHEGRLVY